MTLLHTSNKLWTLVCSMLELSMSEYATEEILIKFLNKIQKSNGEKFLMYSVDHDEGLLEGQG